MNDLTFERSSGSDLAPAAELKMVAVYTLASSAGCSPGEKMAGRYSSKSTVSQIVAVEDLTYSRRHRAIVLKTGRAPSRMTVGPPAERPQNFSTG